MKHWQQEQVKPLDGIAQLQAAEKRAGNPGHAAGQGIAHRQPSQVEPLA